MAGARGRRGAGACGRRGAGAGLMPGRPAPLTSHPCSRPTPRPRPAPTFALATALSSSHVLPGRGRLGPTFPAGCCVHPTEYVRMCTLAWLKKVRSFGTRNVSGCVSTSSASLSGESSPVCGSSELGAGRLQAAQASTRLGSWVLAPRGLCARLRWLVRRARAPERLWAAQSRGRSPGQGQRSQRSRYPGCPFDTPDAQILWSAAKAPSKRCWSGLSSIW